MVVEAHKVSCSFQCRGVGQAKSLWQYATLPDRIVRCGMFDNAELNASGLALALRRHIMVMEDVA